MLHAWFLPYLDSQSEDGCHWTVRNRSSGLIVFFIVWRLLDAVRKNNGSPGDAIFNTYFMSDFSWWDDNFGSFEYFFWVWSVIFTWLAQNVFSFFIWCYLFFSILQRVLLCVCQMSAGVFQWSGVLGRGPCKSGQMWASSWCSMCWALVRRCVQSLLLGMRGVDAVSYTWIFCDDLLSFHVAIMKRFPMLYHLTCLATVSRGRVGSRSSVRCRITQRWIKAVSPSRTSDIGETHDVDLPRAKCWGKVTFIWTCRCMCYIFQEIKFFHAYCMLYPVISVRLLDAHFESGRPHQAVWLSALSGMSEWSGMKERYARLP